VISSFLQQIINGITVGSIYSLVALGYTMVYGIIKLINFAHGDIFMIGAFVGLLVSIQLGANFIVVIFLAMISTAFWVFL